MKRCLPGLAAAFVLLALACRAATGAQAQYPSKTITLVVPFAAGGSNDIVARAIGKKLGEAWGQSVIIDNRAGAGGVIGATFVAGCCAGRPHAAARVVDLHDQSGGEGEHAVRHAEGVRAGRVRRHFTAADGVGEQAAGDVGARI